MTDIKKFKDNVRKISGQQKIPDEIAKVFISSLSSLKGFGLVKKIETNIYGFEIKK